MFIFSSSLGSSRHSMLFPPLVVVNFFGYAVFTLPASNRFTLILSKMPASSSFCARNVWSWKQQNATSRLNSRHDLHVRHLERRLLTRKVFLISHLEDKQSSMSVGDEICSVQLIICRVLHDVNLFYIAHCRRFL